MSCGGRDWLGPAAAEEVDEMEADEDEVVAAGIVADDCVVATSALDTVCGLLSSANCQERTSVRWPVIAAAAAMTGESR